MGEAGNADNCWKEKYGCSIENYIREDEDSNYSVCREERQYAVFLYNILKKYHAHESRIDQDRIHEIITNTCGIPEEADIKHVFYEATFMRDFFERNRRIYWKAGMEEKLLQQSFSPSERELVAENSFNYKLFQYVCKSENVKVLESFRWNQPENNLGQDMKQIQSVIHEIMNAIPDEDMKQIQSVIREMMNATPDLAVIYSLAKKDSDGQHKPDKNYLLFLECKFESYESSYKSGYRQSEIQGKIADFLCNNYLKEKENIEVSPLMKNNNVYASRIVRFTRERNESDKYNEGENVISISDVIELNNNIFK